MSKPVGVVVEREFCARDLHHQCVDVIVGGYGGADVVDLEEDGDGRWCLTCC
ncbi:MAG: hypothetical protein IZT58_13695 [Actinobacteria bacterium]|nr:hypothetical protein [Actinomycetota bacterium]